MALIRFAEGQQRSGSIGASVYSHNRFGAYIRARTVPVNPNTDRQIGIRNLIQNLTIQWQITLTQAQRDAWSWYAANVTWKNKLGEDVHLTGLNHYVRSNVPRIQSNLPRLDIAPTDHSLATAEQNLACTATAATQTYAMTFDDTADWTTEAGGFQAVYCGIPQHEAIVFFGGPWRYMDKLLGQDAPNGEPSSPANLPAQWPIAEGQRLWIRTRIGRADGRLSEFAQVNFLCAA